MDLNRCFEILEISPESTYEEAKAAYRLMAHVWHPDKHAHNDKLYARATSKFKEINAAWSDIEAYFKHGAAREAEAKEAERRAREERERTY
jgi:DnaJ-class molecular chaperone